MKLRKIFAPVFLTLLLAAAASAQTFTSLYTYPETNRNNTGVLFPMQMAQGRDGNFYGTIVSDGTQTFGTVFKMTTTGTFASWPVAPTDNIPLAASAWAQTGIFTAAPPAAGPRPKAQFSNSRLPEP